MSTEEKNVLKKKSNRKSVSIEFHRGGRMEDKQLYMLLAVDPTHPLLQAIYEIIDRAEDGIDRENDGLEVSREVRADLGIAKAVLRNLRVEIEQARLAAMEPKKI